MNVVIVGAGIVGFNLAEELSVEGHDVSIIDQNPKKIKRIADKLDVLSVNGNACLPSVLIKARIREADMVISVTDKDEINLMVCFLAFKFDVPNRFARLLNLEFTTDDKIFEPEELHVDHPINPGEIIIDSIGKIIKTPGAVNIAEFANGEILLRGFDVPENAPLSGKSLAEIQEVCEFNSFLVIALVREGSILIPKKEDVIMPGDKVYILVDKEFLPLVLPMLNRTVDEVQKIVIYGANRMSIQLVKVLEKTIPDVSLIEPSLELANDAADELNQTVVLHGKGTDPELLDDINLKEADMFLSLSTDDESNILAAILAKKQGAKRTVVITQDPDYLPILDSIGMDVTINPRLITVGTILKYLRKGQVVSVHKLIEGEAEILEIIPSADSSVIRKSIKKLKMPDHAMVGAILRNGAMLIPNEETKIEEGDSVIVITLPDSIDRIEKIFGKKQLFMG